MQSKPEVFPYYSPYPAPLIQVPNGLARLTAPNQSSPPIPPCVAPLCVVEPVGEYVAQVVPIPSQLNYAKVQNYAAYGPPEVKSDVSKTPKKEVRFVLIIKVLIKHNFTAL